MSFPSEVTLLILTLNEIEGLKRLSSKINPVWCEQILVMDGNSTDGTVEYAKSLGYEVVKQKTRGLRLAYIESLDYAKGQMLIFFSPDGNSMPELIPKVIAKMREGYDMVIVSRYREGARSYDESMISRLGNWGMTGMINLLFGGHYTDVMVIYRAIRVNLIKELGLDKRNRFLEWAESRLNTIVGLEMLLSIRCAKRKLKVAEIPGDEPVRIGGFSKMKHWRTAMIYLLLIIKEFFSR